MSAADDLQRRQIAFLIRGVSTASTAALSAHVAAEDPHPADNPQYRNVPLPHHHLAADVPDLFIPNAHWFTTYGG
jgi:hypothetical protein